MTAKKVKALETVKLVEVTVVLAIETYTDRENTTVCGMDYINVEPGCDAQIIGWTERLLNVTPTDKVSA